MEEREGREGEGKGRRGKGRGGRGRKVGPSRKNPGYSPATTGNPYNRHN